MSRENHRRHDAMLLKSRHEKADKPEEHHGLAYLLAAASIFGEFAAVRYTTSWLAWLAALFFLLARPKPPLTLETLFKSDFPNLFKTSDVLNVSTVKGDITVQMSFNIYIDFVGKSEFVGFYVGHSDHTYEFCETLAWAPQKAIHEIQSKIEFSGGALGQMTSLKDLTFTGRVFIYHLDYLSLERIVALRAVYSAKNLSVEFRGMDYLVGEAHNPNRKS